MLLFWILLIIVVLFFFAKNRGRHRNKHGANYKITSNIETNKISARGMQFGDSILNDAMIQNEATKMAELFSEQLESRMDRSDGNRNHFTLSYMVSRSSILYNPYDELWGKGVLFRDYNVEKLDANYKIEGVAWALQKLAIPQILQKYRSIVDSDVTFKASSDVRGYFVCVDFSCEILLERFRTL